MFTAGNKSNKSVVNLFSGGRNFKAGVAVGDEVFARFIICVYAISVMFILANIFIATLNELFSAAVQKIIIEMEDQAYDPIDYVILNIKGRYWNVLKKVSELVNRKRGKVEVDRNG